MAIEEWLPAPSAGKSVGSHGRAAVSCAKVSRWGTARALRDAEVRGQRSEDEMIGRHSVRGQWADDQISDSRDRKAEPEDRQLEITRNQNERTDVELHGFAGLSNWHSNFNRRSSETSKRFPAEERYALTDPDPAIIKI